MNTVAINKPTFNWILIQALASKYHVRANVAGRKVILRSCAENLVRMVSAIKVLEGH